MLFEGASEVSSFNRYMLPRVANKADIGPVLLDNCQELVSGTVRQQAPLIDGYHRVLQVGPSHPPNQAQGAAASGPLTQQKALNCSDASTRDLPFQSLNSFGGWSQQDMHLSGSPYPRMKLFQSCGFACAGYAAQREHLVGCF